MLQRPALSYEEILACLQTEYRLSACRVTFLPLGADIHTAVYRLDAENGKSYFLKLRSGPFQASSVELPRFLYEQGFTEIIPPLPTSTGCLFSNISAFKVILYPFTEGRNGYEISLPPRAWQGFGRLLNRLHSLKLPASLSDRLTRETFITASPALLRDHLENLSGYSGPDPLVVELVDYLDPRRGILLDLIGRVETLVSALRRQPREFVLCHADIHAGNLLIEPDGSFYLVDWDAPILAPQERDLMSIGAGLFGGWYSPAVEKKWFYEGYGDVLINNQALAYYRILRILDDLAIECNQILEQEGGLDDRLQALQFLKSNFDPNSTIELALK